MKVIRHIIFLILFSNLYSCIIFQSAEKSDVLLPSETETPGWVLDGRVKEFTPDTIQEYASEPEKSLLISYGFRELFTAKYSNLSDDSRHLIVEIYAMDSDINAFGIYTMKRIENSLENKICGDSYSAGLALFSRKENYYIKIQSETEYPNSNDDMEEFLRIICNKIKYDNPLPQYLSLFQKYEKRNSIVYRIKGYPDLPVLKNIFTKRIDVSDKTKTVFFAKRNSSFDSMKEFSGIINNKNMNFILSGTGDSQTAFSKLNENAYLYISVYKEWIFGTFDAESMPEGEKIIGVLLSDLKQYQANHK